MKRLFLCLEFNVERTSVRYDTGMHYGGLKSALQTRPKGTLIYACQAVWKLDGISDSGFLPKHHRWQQSLSHMMSK